MSDIAIREIQDSILRRGGWSFTPDEIRRNIADRSTVRWVSFDYDLWYFKSADCFNDAIGVIPIINIVRGGTGGWNWEDDGSNPGGSDGSGGDGWGTSF